MIADVTPELVGPIGSDAPVGVGIDHRGRGGGAGGPSNRHPDMCVCVCDCVAMSAEFDSRSAKLARMSTAQFG